MIGAGAMDQRITFQRSAATPDGGGGETYAWANLEKTPTVWAHVKAKGGRESSVEGRVNASFVVVFTIYNRKDLTDLDRIVWNGADYNIRGIRTEGPRALRLVIEAERGVAQ